MREEEDNRGEERRYLQLSASIVHCWRSIGKYCKFIGHEEVTVSLYVWLFVIIFRRSDSSAVGFRENALG